MSETPQITLDADLDFLNLKEVSRILRIAPISVYRLIAKNVLPTFRISRKILFKKSDVIAFLKRSRSGPPDPKDYGRPQT